MKKSYEPLTDVLARHDVEWSSLLETASEVILFGSRTAGEHDAHDWDVLCIGPAPEIRSQELDLISIAVEKTRNETWLQSELAGHVKRYGVWLKGSGEWCASVRHTDETVTQKYLRFTARRKAVRTVWDSLRERGRSRARNDLRRDVQRLALLREGRPVPCRQHLDREWQSRPELPFWLGAAGLESNACWPAI